MARTEQLKDIELKEKVSQEQFRKVLKELLQAIESNQDLPVTVKGQTNSFPAEAFKQGHFRIEYEIDNGEYELELQIKWAP